MKEEKKDDGVMAEEEPYMFWIWAMASTIFRLFLIFFPENINLSSRPEVSTPLTSLRRLAEGYWLKQASLSPYAGSMYHGRVPLAAFGLSLKQYGGLEEMFKRTYGFILKIEDLPPNIGVFWYFFSEVFDFSRNYLLIVFNLYILLTGLPPLAFRLKHRPCFLAFAYLAFSSILKSYPSVGDAALYLSLWALFVNELTDMEHSCFIFCGYIGFSLLSPVMHNIWIWRIQEIVTTGKLSKLEHFETDEKVRTISLFGEVWGIGPATALKLYEKGHRTLEDLKNEDSLTHAQRLGLKYFDDIRTRIPRHEVQEMEQLLQRVGEETLPGVNIVCGGSYRRGKATCGDLDIVITHPDGQSHKGFLTKFVKRLKEINFLREDLIFSTHSEEGTDSGVDTYFGLCTYPGQELRRRIDFKVYPRDIYAFGLIAWTGNDVLNRRLRLLAESKGYRLDDTGLFPATHNSSGNRGARGTASLKLSTEKQVFDFLGFPWLEPDERNL